MEHAVIERFRSLDEAYLARAPKSERMYARFAALSSLNAKQDVESLIERVFEARDQLNDGLGAWKAPARAMRLVFAAALVTAGRSAKHFFDVRDALKERRKATTAKEGQPKRSRKRGAKAKAERKARAAAEGNTKKKRKRKKKNAEAKA